MGDKYIIQFAGIERILLDTLNIQPSDGKVVKRLNPKLQRALFQWIRAEIIHRFRLNGFSVNEEYDAENPIVNIKGKITKIITSHRYRPNDMEDDIKEKGLTRFFFLSHPHNNKEFLTIAKENNLGYYRQSLPISEYIPADKGAYGQVQGIADSNPDTHFTSMLLNEGKRNTRSGKIENFSISDNELEIIYNEFSNNNQREQSGHKIRNCVKSIGKWIAREIICSVTEHLISSLFQELI